MRMIIITNTIIATATATTRITIGTITAIRVDPFLLPIKIVNSTQ